MKKTKFLKVYLISALTLGIFGLLDIILALLNLTNAIYLSLMAVIFFLWFVINIIALTIFIHNRLSKITYVLPTYYILTFIGLTAFSILMSISTILPMIQNVVTMLLLVGSLFEIGFSVYLLRSFNKINS